MHKSISYNGEVCTTLLQLWDSLHTSYNSAANQPWDENLLSQVEEWKERDWYLFSASEIQEALSKCSNTSAPEPDHLSWCHLKHLFKNHNFFEKFLCIANACVFIGHWPSYFKVSTSVIIPKPNKPNYTTPKAFRPIVLLNTMGKLIEKLISVRMHFEGNACGIFHPSQFGETQQHSTDDADAFFTHAICLGWAQDKVTSTLAFDVAQFFPSLNHQVLTKIIQKAGFNNLLVSFFKSHLTGQQTRYIFFFFFFIQQFISWCTKAVRQLNTACTIYVNTNEFIARQTVSRAQGSV